MDKRKEANKYGIIAENLFINKCSLNNIPVFKNQNVIGEIDYVILVKDKLLRMQVKSTIEPVKDGLFYVSTKRNKNKLYKNIDYIAAYLHSRNEWFIIPFYLVDTLQAICFNIKNNAYDPFKDNWNFDVIETKESIKDNNVENREQSIKLFQDGVSKSEIARRLKVHYSVINRWLRDAGYGIRKLNESKENIINLYNSGKTMKEVAKELNMTVSTTRNLFRKYNICVKRNTNPNGKKGKQNVS